MGGGPGCWGKGGVCWGYPRAKFKMAPEKLPSSLESCLKNHLFFVLNFGRVSNLEVSDKSDSIELSIPIFELMEGTLEWD